MDAIVFAEPLRVHLVWLAVAAAAACAFFEFRSADRLQRFVSATMQARLALRRTRLRRALQVALVFATLADAPLRRQRTRLPLRRDENVTLNGLEFARIAAQRHRLDDG